MFKFTNLEQIISILEITDTLLFLSQEYMKVRKPETARLFLIECHWHHLYLSHKKPVFQDSFLIHLCYTKGGQRERKYFITTVSVPFLNDWTKRIYVSLRAFSTWYKCTWYDLHTTLHIELSVVYLQERYLNIKNRIMFYLTSSRCITPG